MQCTELRYCLALHCKNVCASQGKLKLDQSGCRQILNIRSGNRTGWIISFPLVWLVETFIVNKSKSTRVTKPKSSDKPRPSQSFTVTKSSYQLSSYSSMPRTMFKPITRGWKERTVSLFQLQYCPQSQSKAFSEKLSPFHWTLVTYTTSFLYQEQTDNKFPILLNYTIKFIGWTGFPISPLFQSPSTYPKLENIYV